MYYNSLLVVPSKRLFGRAYLNAVITVGKVLHRLELLIDDADAGFVRPVDDAFNVLGGLAHGLQLLVDALCSLDGRLRVELGWM